MLLTDARRLARETADRELIPLAASRSLWDHQQIAEGVALLSATLPRGSVGPYQLQAAIAAVHDEAARADETDWPQILATLRDAQAHVRQPGGRDEPRNRGGDGARSAEGLELLAPLKTDARLADHHRLDAVEAHLLELAGDRRGAIRHYQAAAGKTGSLPERNYLLTRASRLTSEPRPMNEKD